MELRYRFCKTSRIQKSSEFQKVFAQTEFRFRRGPLLVLARQSGADAPRLGLVMRKKNLRLASQRNLMKRLIRENFRLQQHGLPPLDIIFMSLGGIEQFSRRDLHRDIRWLLDKLTEEKPNV